MQGFCIRYRFMYQLQGRSIYQMQGFCIQCRSKYQMQGFYTKSGVNVCIRCEVFVSDTGAGIKYKVFVSDTRSKHQIQDFCIRYKVCAATWTVRWRTTWRRGKALRSRWAPSRCPTAPAATTGRAQRHRTPAASTPGYAALLAAPTIVCCSSFCTYDSLLLFFPHLW